MMNNQRRPRRVPPAFWIACLGLAFASLFALTAAAQPTVNGLFYGDGDDAEYILWDTSFYGSNLYIYYHAPTTTLYVALVVDRTVNDNVFGASHTGFSGNYMQTAGWGGGGGQQRSAGKLTDSEFASFDFACAAGSPNQWAWQQGYACLSGSTWVSNSTCGTSAALGTTGYPPSLQSASSFAVNMNTYNNATIKPWNRDFFGTGINDWKSPFSFSDPNTTPANNPNTVIGLPGYPASGAITYAGTYSYEWPMVYEWSLNVAGDGTTTGTGCGNNALFLVTGASHHSPMKTGVEGDFDDECGLENDCFPPGGDNNPVSDFGDLPDSYTTLLSSGGPRHEIRVTGPYLGSTIEIETDGSPTSDATGDGDEEDGVTAVIDENWDAGSTQSFEATVTNAPSGAVLAGWFDWNGDGDFDDPGEFFTWSVTNGTNTLDVTVGADFDWQTDNLYSRFRIFSSAATAPGGTLEQADYSGTATDGEVEDYLFPAEALPVTMNAFTSEMSAGGEITARWQTASETDNVGFEVWGLVGGEWQPLTGLIPSRTMSGGVPQSYEARFEAPEGLEAVELVDYDLRGRQERFGSFRVGDAHGEFQPVREIDWSGPRAERDERLRGHGFADLAAAARPAGAGGAAEGRWKKVHRGEPVRGTAAAALSIDVPQSTDRPNAGGLDRAVASVEVASGALTHVAVTEDGVQRVSYETLRDAGLDLAGVQSRDVAVTWRGEPVARWIDGAGKFGPGSAIEFVGRAPSGDDALYVGAALYQVSVDRSRAREAQSLGQGKARSISPSYLRTSRVDRQRLYRSQSPTGDPWLESSPLVRPGRVTTVSLDLPVDGPVADGSGRLVVGLGSISDLPDLRAPSGDLLPEHNVEVWLRAPGGASTLVAESSAFGQSDWTVEAALPAGTLTTGVHQVELRFTTEYFFSLVAIDDYAVHYASPYNGPSLDFAADPAAAGYRIEGFTAAEPAAYAAGTDGSLTRLAPRSEAAGGGWAVELRAVDGAHYWVTETPHAPQAFTTAAPSADLFAGPADLVVIAGSSFVGTPALADYVAQHAGLDPIVVDVEDVYNAVGFGMALPSAITDYLAARDAIHPFSQVQLVGSDCYDRRGYVSSCVSFVPLPTARVGVNHYTPSQNRLVDLDGDGVGDKAVAQFSVRDAGELATIVAKGDAWRSSGLAAERSALFVAEEPDGVHSFAGQVSRLDGLLGWSGTEILDLADHPQIQTARDAFRQSLADGRALTAFSGHSSPSVWSFRGLLTTGTAAALTNQGKPTLMVPLACETTYDVSPSANVLGHQLLYAGQQGALAISGAVALSNLSENELMANRVLTGLEAGLSLGEAVQQGREALGGARQELLDNWVTQGDVAVRMER